MIRPMKRKMIRLLVIGILLASTYASYAQKVIKVHDRALKDSIGENAKHNTKQLGYLLLLKRLTRNTKDEVESTQQLQQDYREFLRQTSSTASLAVARQEAKQDALSLTLGTADHLADYTFADHLHQVYAERTEPIDKSQRLYEQLIPYDATRVFSNLTSFSAYQQARRLHVTALEEMSKRRKLQLAQTYQQLAQQKITQADELQAQLSRNHRFSMTEAERLELLRRMQDALSSSQQLKARTDALIQQASRDSFSKQQVLDRYQHAQERDVIATTPLF